MPRNSPAVFYFPALFPNFKVI